MAVTGPVRDADMASTEHEVLRRLARSAFRESLREAHMVAERYARLCVATFRSAVPLVWPRRTAGRTLRIVVLVGPATESGMDSALVALSRLPRDRFDVELAAIDGRALPDDVANANASIVALPAYPDAKEAKRLAARDPDVLIDLAGLDAASGPLLASRPARWIATPVEFAARNVAPLIDDSDTPAAELERMLAERWRALPPDGEMPNASGMAKVWADAVRLHQGGDLPTACEHYTRVLALQPGYAPAHYLLGVAQRDSGDAAGARRSFDAAIAAAPAFVEARIALARAVQAAGDLSGAIALCADGIAATNRPLALHRALGAMLLAAREGQRATEAFAAALAIDPADADSHYNHGVALQMSHRRKEAAAAYRRALASRPDLVAAEFNLATLHQEEGAVEEAIVAYGNVIARDPSDAAAYRNLGEVLLATGRIDAWHANFDRFEARCPEALPLAVQALEVLQFRGDFGKLDRYLESLNLGRFRAQTEMDLCDSLEQLLYLLLFFDVDPAMIHRYSQMYDRVARNVYGVPFARPASRRQGRIRVGYLSADLRNHVMGKMMWQALQGHDRSRFALHFYSLSRERDEWTARFESIADSFVSVTDCSEREAAVRIAADDLDLLVDLSTHTKGAAPGILAFKPARVLLTSIASAGTVGLSTIDFKLTDHHADVAASQVFQIETLLPMDGCVYVYRHVAAAVEHPFHRSALDLPADAILIGAFVTGLKLSRRCLALWREILERVPRARIVFSPTHAAYRDAYVRIAAAGGIVSDRLCFLPQGRDDAENRARYGLIDLVLDPMPFGGVNGTLEALDMGVPVVTLVGQRHGERAAYSILENLGVSATVARTEREYVDIAVRLATDSTFMREMRADMRARLPASRLADRQAYTRELERVYLAALAVKAPEVLRDTGVS